jgi:hypothetical protein
MMADNTSTVNVIQGAIAATDAAATNNKELVIVITVNPVEELSTKSILWCKQLVNVFHDGLFTRVNLP